MLEDVLIQRNGTHGDYCDNSRIVSLIMREVSPHSMTDAEYLGVMMIACKLSRIISGDASFTDHWLDIQGYAQNVLEAIDNYDEGGYNNRQMELNFGGNDGSKNV